MKKIILLLLGVGMGVFEAWACDLCSIYVNLEPNDLQSSMGINYRHRSFLHGEEQFLTQNNTLKHASGNTVISEAVMQEELFKSYDLWFNYFLNQKWQINGMMTFADNYYRENDSTLFNIAGPGDFTLMGKYLFFNSKVTDTSDWAFRLVGGGGVQIPIGSFNKTYLVTPSSSKKGNVIYGSPYEELDPHMQAGSGSFDFLFLLEGMLRYKKAGISTNLSYQFNTKNANNFRFANRLNWNMSGFYLLTIKSFTFTPNSGLSLESSQRDRFRGKAYRNSGGLAMFLTGGAKVYYDKFSLGATYFSPIRQDLYDNQIPNNQRLIADLTYYF
ncbi:MAG: hypothetical protein RIC95_11340 [Vicingaceae bacterium]